MNKGRVEMNKGQVKYSTERMITRQNLASADLELAWIITGTAGGKVYWEWPDYQQQRCRKRMRWRRTLGTEADQILP
jgi:hypothetical protein